MMSRDKLKHQVSQQFLSHDKSALSHNTTFMSHGDYLPAAHSSIQKFDNDCDVMSHRRYLPAAHSSIQKFDNDCDVILCSKM